MIMTKEEAIKFWEFRYENAKDYTDQHWEAQERREHREYVEALRMAIEALSEPSGDLISRAEAIERFCEFGTSLEQQGKTMITMVDAKYAFIKTLESLPSADTRIGEWIFNPKDAIELMFTKPKCSKCGFESVDGGNFCPNCGADMRGEK